MAATAALCHWFVMLPWTESMLVGAALSPTDPIFAAAIVGREEVSIRVRRLLNVESGFNDGLALPAVMILLGQVSGHSVGYRESAWSLMAGIAIGVAVPWLVIMALDSRYFAAAGGVYKRLGAIGIGLLVFALTSTTHANAFLAAFVAGITIGIHGPTIKRSFFVIGETAGELVKLAAVLIFGSLLSVEFFRSMPVGAYVFALLVLLVVRPIALAPALAGTDLTRQERMTIVWFGPKGFSSLLFGFLVLSTKTVHASMMFGLIGLVVVASILAHSSTDTLVAHSFRDSMLPRKNAA
jgi:NhaP-type Na+/H+ or K+/H+ antiporter